MRCSRIGTCNEHTTTCRGMHLALNICCVLACNSTWEWGLLGVRFITLLPTGAVCSLCYMSEGVPRYKDLRSHWKGGNHISLFSWPLLLLLLLLSSRYFFSLPTFVTDEQACKDFFLFHHHIIGVEHGWSHHCTRTWGWTRLSSMKTDRAWQG